MRNKIITYLPSIPALSSFSLPSVRDLAPICLCYISPLRQSGDKQFCCTRVDGNCLFRKGDFLYSIQPMNFRKRGIFNTIEDFLIEESSKPLGRGAYGTVRLATHRVTLRRYAIKIVELNEEFDEYEMQLLARQIDIHFSSQHPHIIRLWDVLTTDTNVYMVLDYAPNGNLFHYQLHKKEPLSEPQIYRLFSQVVEAIAYMHNRDTFHRDIKPENIILDHDYNALLCDMGWAATDLNLKRKTFCGTHQYMSPEMISKTEYDYRIDIWALGILLYELAHNKAPYVANTLEEMEAQVNKGTYDLSKSLSIELRNLIISILQYEPEDRPTIAKIIENPWMIQQRAICQRDNNRAKSIDRHGFLHEPERKRFKGVSKKKGRKISKNSSFGHLGFQFLDSRKQSAKSSFHKLGHFKHLSNGSQDLRGFPTRAFAEIAAEETKKQYMDPLKQTLKSKKCRTLQVEERMIRGIIEKSHCNSIAESTEKENLHSRSKKSILERCFRQTGQSNFKMGKASVRKHDEYMVPKKSSKPRRLN